MIGTIPKIRYILIRTITLKKTLLAYECSDLLR